MSTQGYIVKTLKNELTIIGLRGIFVKSFVQPCLTLFNNFFLDSNGCVDSVSVINAESGIGVPSSNYD